jgi:hypothetical protein
MIQFLTLQTVCLVLIKRIYNVDTLNLHFLTLMLLLGGGYITFVKQFLVVKYGENRQIDISGRWLSLFNIIFHVFPFLYVWICFDANRTMLLETYLYLLCYFYLFRPHDVYYVEGEIRTHVNVFLCILAMGYYIVISG